MTFQTSGSLTTATKTADGTAVEITTDATVPTDTSISLTVKQDESGGTTADNTETISVGDGTNTTSLSNFTNTTGSSWWLTIDLSTTDDTVSPTFNSAVLSFASIYERTTTVTGGGSVDATRQLTFTRSSIIESGGEADTDRVKQIPRTMTIQTNGAVESDRQPIAKQRQSTTTADIALRTRAEFNEVFPDEQTASLSWDFSFDEPFGFVSEWFDERADLPIDTDAFTVVVDSRIVQTYELGVEYDVDGDGEAEYRTDTKTVERDGQTLTFPNLGEPGQYRLYIQKMRLGDYLRAVTVGPTRY